MRPPSPLSQAAASPKERQARSRLRQLLNEPGLLRASLIEMKRRCGNASCRCAKAKRYWHLSWYIGQSSKGSNRMKYIPEGLMPEVSLWVERYQEARKLLDEVSDESWNKIVRQSKRAR